MRFTLFIAGLALLCPDLALAQEISDNPRRRWEAFYERRAFPFDRIPAGAREAAWRQARALRSDGLLGAPPPVSGTQWEALGPTSIPWFGTSIGRMSAIAVHPTDQNTIYVGGAQGGVWKTTDGGATWASLTDQECSLAMGSIAIDPVDPDIVYAGTGEQHFSGDSYYGCGVLRSEDGGATWTQLGASVFVTSTGGARISRVKLLPSTVGTPASTTVLAASDLGLYRSTDGGGTWTEVLVGGLGCGSPQQCSVTDLVLDPDDDQTIYAAVRTRGIYKSTNGGVNWAFMGSGFASGSSVGRINLGLAPSAPDTLYASVHNASGSDLLGIWWTTDGAATWSQRSAAGASCGFQCWYDMYVTVHPTEPGTVFFGGVSLYRSTDHAQTFGNVTGPIHVDQHLMVFDPQDPETLYAANDGGIYRSTTRGNSWTSLNDGLELTQFYEGISLHPSDRTIILGGTQDNGTLQFEGAPSWALVLGGDGGFTAIDRDDPGIRYAETQWSTGSSFSGPRRSDGGSYTRKVNGIDVSDRALFIPPLVMDPSVSSTLYFGTYRLYRTTDRAESWTLISPDLTGGGNGRISAIAPAPSEPDRIYVGASSGLLYVTENSGTDWELRAGGLPVRFIQDIAVDRADPLTAYTVVSGFNSGHVFRTVDGGISWSDVSGNLPDTPVNAVVLDPADRGFVMIGTDVGVFVSADSGGTWTPLPDGMPNVAVFDIAYNPATASLVAATHGRGMFELQLDRPLTLAVVPEVRRDTVTVGTTATSTDSAHVVLTGMGAASADWSVTHGAGATWITPGPQSGTGSGTFTWMRDPSGLTGGVYVDTIIVTSAGAVDAPLLFFDSLVVEGTLAMSVTPAARVDTILLGDTATHADSADVAFAGTGASTAGWMAAAVRGEWITVTTPSGTGPGQVRWERSGAGLALGTYVDTIAITAPSAAGSPAAVVDSLVVEALAAAFPVAAVHDTAVSGSIEILPGSALLLLDGGANDTTTWMASHGGAPWLTLISTSGAGSATIEWGRSAADLVDGVYRDTITVVTANGDSAQVEDVFVVIAPEVATACAADHLLGTSCLDAVQRRWLDLAGNGDGRFNLGDLVAFFARGGGGAP